MSYSTKIIGLYLLFSVLFYNCEDTKNKSHSTTQKETKVSEIATKKTGGIKNENSSETTNDTLKEATSTFPYLTEENVVSFLRNYGEKNPETKVVISTPQGDIHIQLFKDTPLHRANFIYLVKRGYFNSTYFHRVVPNFIIQAGRSDNRTTNEDRYAIGKSYRLPNEIKHNHTIGTLSGAKYYRDNKDKKTEPYEFFIFLGPKTATKHLDGNYTVFGKVSKGMDVVKKISEVDRDNDEWPILNVTLKAEVIN